MNNEKTNKQISELVGEHHARKPLLSPAARAAIWTGLALLTAAVFFSLIQPFRSGFASHLIKYPLLMVEVASALIFTCGGAVWAFRSAVPGARIPRSLKVLLALSAAVFGTTTALSFSVLGAESTTHGGRAFCWIEVLICGLVTLTAIIILLRRGYPRFAWHQVVLLAFTAALPGGILMQLACAYNPEHSFIFHYLPMLAIALASLSIQRLLHR